MTIKQHNLNHAERTQGAVRPVLPGGLGRPAFFAGQGSPANRPGRGCRYPGAGMSGVALAATDTAGRHTDGQAARPGTLLSA